MFTTKDELACLNDREGIPLLAEAMSQDQMGGRFRDLLRVFERAFAESADRLVPMLPDFLALRPRLVYSKTEAKYWIVRLRGRAIHADRHPPLTGADLENYVDRILLAAYEVLFNKENWHSYDSSRRDVWTPLTGPLDTDGNCCLQPRTEAPHLGQLYETYGVSPLTCRRPAPVRRLGPGRARGRRAALRRDQRQEADAPPRQPHHREGVASSPTSGKTFSRGSSTRSCSISVCTIWKLARTDDVPV